MHHAGQDWEPVVHFYRVIPCEGAHQRLFSAMSGKKSRSPMSCFLTSLINFNFCIFIHLINYAWPKSGWIQQISKIDSTHCVEDALDTVMTNFCRKCFFLLGDIKLKLSCAKTVFLDKIILITSIFNLKSQRPKAALDERAWRTLDISLLHFIQLTFKSLVEAHLRSLGNLPQLKLK